MTLTQIFRERHVELLSGLNEQTTIQELHSTIDMVLDEVRNIYINDLTPHQARLLQYLTSIARSALRATRSIDVPLRSIDQNDSDQNTSMRRWTKHIPLWSNKKEFTTSSHAGTTRQLVFIDREKVYRSLDRTFENIDDTLSTLSNYEHSLQGEQHSAQPIEMPDDATLQTLQHVLGTLAKPGYAATSCLSTQEVISEVVNMLSQWGISVEMEVSPQEHIDNVTERFDIELDSSPVSLADYEMILPAFLSDGLVIRRGSLRQRKQGYK
jgi:hypothetical protein